MPGIIICNRAIKNRFMEVVISYFFNFFFGLKDPLSGFKFIIKKYLKKKNFENIVYFFLVDFLILLIKKKKSDEHGNYNQKKRR